MKIVVVNQQTAFVRHWFRWYNVKRSGEDWRPLEIGKRYVKPRTIDEIAQGIEKAAKAKREQKAVR